MSNHAKGGKCSAPLLRFCHCQPGGENRESGCFFQNASRPDVKYPPKPPVKTAAIALTIFRWPGVPPEIENPPKSLMAGLMGISATGAGFQGVSSGIAGGCWLIVYL